MFVNVANGPGSGLGAWRPGMRGMGAAGRGARVVAVPRLVYRRPVGRGLRGLGDCTSLGTSYSNTPNGACRDNASGSVVDCKATVCASASGGGAAVGPSFVPSPVIENIPVGGFTGTLAVPSLASALGDMLAAKESPFNANLIAKGAVNVNTDAQDFAALATQHCTEYAASSGCDNPAAVAQQFVNQYLAWAKSQPASAYQASDSGSLFSPTTQPVQAVVNNGPTLAPSVAITNLSRSDGSFQVGDSWRIDITGAPNQPITVLSTQNGTAVGSATPMGKTDATGRASVSGSFAQNTIGTWREMWTIGSSPAPVLVFSVVAAAAGQQTGGSGAGSGTGSGSGSGGSGSGSGGGSPAPPVDSSLSDFFSQTFTIAGYSIPVWGAGVAALGALFVFGGKKF